MGLHTIRETFGKCSFLPAQLNSYLIFNRGSSLRKTNILPHKYIEYFEDSAKASLRAQFETDAEIGQKGGGFAKVSKDLRNSFYSVHNDKNKSEDCPQ